MGAVRVLPDLPFGWRWESLGDVASWSSGGTPKSRTPHFYGGHIPWAVIGDLNDGVVTHTVATITSAGLAASSAKIVPAGTVLVAMYGSIGKLGIAGMEMATNQAIACARPMPSVDPRYLFYWLLGQRPTLLAAGKGGTQANISQSILKPWPIPVPPLEEQRRIVAILDDHLSRLDAADSLTALATRRLVAFVASGVDAAVRSVPFVDQHLSDVVNRIEAGRSFGSSNRPALDSEWGIVKVSAMTWGEFRETENKAVRDESKVDPRFEIRSGDILVSRANTTAYVGAPVMVGHVRPRLLLSDKSLRLIPAAGIDPRWLHAVLQAPASRRQMSALATGTKDSMRNLSQANLLSVSVPVPSGSDQAVVVQRVRAVTEAADRLNAEIEATRDRTKALRRSLLDAAFTGRLTGSAVTDALLDLAATESFSVFPPSTQAPPTPTPTTEDASHD